MGTNPLQKFLPFLLLTVMVLLVGGGLLLQQDALPHWSETTPTPAPFTPGESIAGFEQPSPDGKYTAALSAADPGMHGSAITLTRADSKDVKVLAEGDDSSWVTNPIWSPDGKTLAYVRVVNGRVNDYEIASTYQLWVYEIKTSQNRLITDSDAFNPSIRFDGTADIKWLSNTQIQYPNNEAFPIVYYTVDIKTLETNAEVSKGIPKTADAAALPAEVPYYSQCDSRWGSKVLGTCSQYTICQQGCAISSTAMVFKYFGIDTDPLGMNNWLKSNNGYAAGCLINWSTAANMAPDKLTWVAWVNGADWARLRYELDSGYPVILEVPFSNGQHFVVATGYYGDTYYINDPYYSSRTTLASYGNTFKGMRIYHGPTKEPPSCPASTSTQTYVCQPTLTPEYNNNPCKTRWYPIRGFSGFPNYLVENVEIAADSANQGSWTPDLPAAGRYKVEAYIAAHGTFSKACTESTMTFGADSSQAKYVVHGAKDTVTEAVRDQLPLNDEWLNLGEYSFDAGKTGFVTLSDVTGETKAARNLSFGAMRFTLIGPAEYPQPTLSLLTPSLKHAGAVDFSLTLTGSGFFPESVVRWNGSDRPTTYISPTTLSASISAADLATAGNAQVTVFNPAPGGGESTPSNFSVLAISPLKNEKLTTSTVNFDWSDIPNAGRYQLQLATNSSFTSLLKDVKGSDSSYSYDVPLTTPNIYYWRIRAKVEGSWRDWSPVWKFNSMDALTPPALTEPGYRVTMNLDSPTLTWQPVVNGVTYKVQVAKDKTFLLVLHRAILPESSWALTLPDGKYFWRVRAIDASGYKGPWSEVGIFKVDAVP